MSLYYWLYVYITDFLYYWLFIFNNVVGKLQVSLQPSASLHWRLLWIWQLQSYKLIRGKFQIHIYIIYCKTFASLGFEPETTAWLANKCSTITPRGYNWVNPSLHLLLKQNLISLPYSFIIKIFSSKINCCLNIKYNLVLFTSHYQYILIALLLLCPLAFLHTYITLFEFPFFSFNLLVA